MKKKADLKRVLKVYRCIPTALTLGNLLCGFTAVLNAFTISKIPSTEMAAKIPDIMAISAWLIFAAMLFDMFDGWAARKLKASTDIGAQMDSLADMVTFGLTPAIMVAVLSYTMPNRFIGESFRWVWLLCGVYVVCAALRLAIYNVIATTGKESKGFQGLPSPGAAAGVVSLVFVYQFCKRHGELSGWLARFDSNSTIVKYLNNGAIADYVINLLPVYACILGLLMVSKIPYAHFGKWLGSKRHYKLKMALLIVYCLAFRSRPLIVATVSINAYILWAPIKYIFTFKRKKVVPERANSSDKEQVAHSG